MLQKLSYNLSQALSALIQRPLQSFLTSLGIIFGVGAVIAVMAIGEGAKQEVLEQMKILGSNNIIVTPVAAQSEEEIEESLGDEAKKQKWSPGLTMADVESIEEIIPGIQGISPEIVLETNFIRAQRKRSGKLVGIGTEFFEDPSFSLQKGNLFTPLHFENSAPVCIIGADVVAKFFPQEEPLGNRIKVGKNWLTVVGVANRRGFSRSSLLELGIRDYNMDIYAPVNTVLLRYVDRARISPQDMKEALARNRSSDEESEPSAEAKNYHQLNRMVVRVEDEAQMYEVAEILRRMLKRRHNGVIDTEVVIPEELLAQKQETTQMFNYVLIAIAAISLLVGGIGIMNIMLASVMERIKEIGVRLSLGATKRDIVTQFMSEAVALALVGGLIGVATGVGFSLLIEWSAGVLTIVTWVPIVVSFLVAFVVGVLFGFFPALKAARQDPVVSLRHD